MQSHSATRFHPRLSSLRTVIAACFIASTLTSAALAEVSTSVSGFGSFVGGKVINGDGYIANYTELGIYGKNGSATFGPSDDGWMNQETRLGVQGTVTLDPATRITAQVVSRGTRSYSPEVEWLFVGRELATNLNVQAGKLRIPAYMYSDKIDVGFAYPWLRVPADAYSLDSVNFNGVKLNYDMTEGEFGERLSVWAGTDNEKNSKLMSYLFNTQIDRNHRFVGIVADSTYGPAELRLSYTKDNMKQATNDPANAFRNEKFNEEFIDVAFQYQLGDLTLMAEWNRDRPFYRSQFVSAIYQFGVNSVYLTQSKFKLDEPWEKHHTVSLGYRRDIGSNMDVKFDITHMVDEGKNPFTGDRNPVIKIKPGHATTVSASFDFIF